MRMHFSSVSFHGILEKIVDGCRIYLLISVHILQLKVDRIKLIELCGSSESEFSSVSYFTLW